MATDAPGTPDTTTVLRTCPLCEATCGLVLDVRPPGPAGDAAIVRVRGDRDDVFSHGYLCPKGAALRQLDADPDRLRRPLVRRGGRHVEVDWDEAFAVVADGLAPVLAAGDRDAFAVYLGNPSAHNLSLLLYGRVLLQALGTRNMFSASTVDQMPKQVSCGLMFGTALSVPIPDVDRTDLLVLLGANPYESNGSLLTAPDLPGRLEALRARGGRLVVVDPRRTRTAEAADVHVALRPGTDAFWLAAIAATLFEEELVDLGDAAPYVVGVDAVRDAVAPFTPEAVAEVCDVAPDVTRRVARDLAAAPRAAVYARIGTCTVEFGTTAQWLVDVVNTLTGNLDRVGGVLFPKAAAAQSNSTGTPGRGRGVRFGRRHSRVRGAPEVFGELPVACLAEEIETPGDGQVRALFTVAGNPVLSTPDSARLDRALASLEFMVSVDVYLNETTRHADVVLPGPSVLHKAHYPLAFHQLSVRNVAHWTPPSLPLPDGVPDEWEILLRLTAIVSGAGADADLAALDDMVAATLAHKAVQTPDSPVEGRDAGDLLAALAADGRVGPARLVDLMLRTGPYQLTLADLEAHPHGYDLGPLQPRLPEVLRTPSGAVELAPQMLIDDTARLQAHLDESRAAPPRADGDGLVLVGRRDLRSNNSWMHNVSVLVSGPPRCTLHVHPDDAAALDLVDGAEATVTSRTGSISLPVQVTDAVRRGVVSVPHGWGHGADGTSMTVANAHAGANVNILADAEVLDPLSGNAVLNAIPVAVAAVR